MVVALLVTRVHRVDARRVEHGAVAHEAPAPDEDDRMARAPLGLAGAPPVAAGDVGQDAPFAAQDGARAEHGANSVIRARMSKTAARAPGRLSPMACIHKEIHIDADPADAWDALRDWGALHERLVPGFVTAARLDGEARIVTFFDGSTVRE